MLQYRVNVVSDIPPLGFPSELSFVLGRTSSSVCFVLVAVCTCRHYQGNVQETNETPGTRAAPVQIRFPQVVQQNVYFPSLGSSRPLVFSRVSFPASRLSFFSSTLLPPTPSPGGQVVIRATAAYQLIPKAAARAGEKKEATEEIRGKGVRNAENITLCLSAWVSVDVFRHIRFVPCLLAFLSHSLSLPAVIITH